MILTALMPSRLSMTDLARCLIPNVTLFLLAGCVTTMDPAIAELAPQSEFMFIGTVQVKNSSTMPAGEVTDLAVVHVDEILSAPPIFQNLRNEQITVKMTSLADAVNQEKRLFFSNGWLFGEGVAVVEVGSFRLAQVDTDTETLKSQIDEVLQAEKDAAMQERLARAAMVVSGRVVEVGRNPEAVSLVTEHDPEWWDATIEVENFMKGDEPAPKVIVSFAHSMDVMWLAAPKLEVGDEGIFILHDDYPEGFESLRAPNPAALETEDIQPSQNMALIEELLRR